MITNEILSNVLLHCGEAKDYLYKVEEYINNDMFNVIEEIGSDSIVIANENEKVKEVLDQIDLVIPGDAAILEQLDLATHSKIKELQKFEFFHEAMKRIIRNQKTVYLFTVQESELEVYRSYIEQQYGDQLQIVGTFSVESAAEDLERIVNDINILMPDVIFSTLGSPKQELFLHHYRNMINAKLWLGFEKDKIPANGKRVLGNPVTRFLAKQKIKAQSSKESEDGNL